MKSCIPISALAIALASGAAFAGGNKEHGGSTAQFESLDRNSDQRLSQTEASADRNVSSKFAALDVDGDGFVTKREFTAHMEKGEQQQQQPMPPDEPRNPY